MKKKIKKLGLEIISFKDLLFQQWWAGYNVLSVDFKIKIWGENTSNLDEIPGTNYTKEKENSDFHPQPTDLILFFQAI